MTAAETAKEVRLASRPEGTPTLDNFAVAEVEVPKPGAGQILVRNTWLSVDPYMRGRMSSARSYVAPFEVGKVMDGGAIGEVVESNADGVAVGDVVLHGLGWRTHAVLDPSRVRVLDPEAAPVQAHLSVLGMPGLTAYAGLFDVAGMREGDTVFVSGAAGAVGSIVGQLARLRGAGRVIGSAGSAEKVRWLRDDLGFDVAFNYKDGPVRDQLREAAPDGVDVYFDNVGGDHLEAAISALNVHGRIAVCGMISQYNATEPAPAPRNLAQIIAKRFTMRGFLVGDHEHLRQEFLDEVGPLVRDGGIAYTETVVRGIERAPHAFLDLLSGGNTGKMLVRL
ncbi:NADP-dependent oxidoreductase [Saccharomonospora xinjiangensis]|uniref:Putative NADP-dependent oxidoreductase n=1 Tax=Saccharomonospora xinjiangensis XJ-54 TaxID=882086 RepID=I0V1M4_9PSEU|nr:NADP-dependent oxidoreductase [Saccharomonospora xinjiangensis]EID54027.1 putative NADP-dependent oxidoreductase [Saccharomonospora xinjiangensis XJ-54]